MSAKHLTMKAGISVIVRYLADIHIYPTSVRYLSRDIRPPYILLRFSAQERLYTCIVLQISCKFLNTTKQWIYICTTQIPLPIGYVCVKCKTINNIRFYLLMTTYDIYQNCYIVFFTAKIKVKTLVLIKQITIFTNVEDIQKVMLDSLSTEYILHKLQIEHCFSNNLHVNNLHVRGLFFTH